MSIPELARNFRRFDPATAQLEGTSAHDRKLSQLEDCYVGRDEYLAALQLGDPVIYRVSSLEEASGDGDLHLGLGLLMPGKVGAEYYLTRGHLHAWREAAEIYIGLSGEGLMLLETEDGTDQAVPITTESIVYVPGLTAHRTVNTGSTPLTYLGIYSARAGHDYSTVAQNNFRQVVVEVDGQPNVVQRTTWLESQKTRAGSVDR